MIRGVFYTALFLLTAQVQASADARNSIIDALVSDLCNNRIIMLGENNHGDGNSPAFKTALTKRLIDECGFDNLVFEASFYDSTAIMQKVRNKRPVTSDMIKSAMGSIRYNSREIAPLIPFTTERVKSGALTISGMDDQISIVGSFYTLGDMSADFAAYIAGDREGECSAILEQRLWYRYSDEAPYTPEAREPILKCLTEIATVIEEKTKPLGQDDREFAEMVENMRRVVTRDFTDPNSLQYRRDKSMFMNLSSLINKARADAKFIVWTVNAHAAKTTDGFKNFRGGKNLGALMHEKYGDDVYALGFTAAGGTYKFGRTVKNIPTAPTGSLEAQALADTDQHTVFLTHKTLAKFGNTISNIDSNMPASSDWSKAFDGVVVFRTGKPTENIQ
jgi:erythromycin esterase-like protein